MKKRGNSLALTAILLTALGLVACGSSTPTPVAPTTRQTTVTPIPPTVTPVLLNPTLIVPTQTATAGATLAPLDSATPAFVRNNTPVTAFLTATARVPQITTPTPAAIPPSLDIQLPLTSLELIEVDPALVEGITNQMVGASSPIIKFYVSNNALPDVRSSVSDALIKMNYLAASPLTPTDDPVIAIYTRKGAPDVVFSAGTIPANPADLTKTMLNLPELSQEAAQKFAGQLKGKKTLVVLISAPGLLQSQSPNSHP